MKKLLALFLVVVVFVGSTRLTVYADNESLSTPVSKTEIPVSYTTSEDEEKGAVPIVSEDNDNSKLTGKVKVIINTQYFKKNISTLSAKLTNVNETYSGKLDSTKENSQVFEFENISNGIYTLTIQGNGYETVTKEINVNSNESILRYVNTNKIADNIKDNGFGTIGYGDFNQDRLIDKQDKEIITKTIFSENEYDSLIDIDDNSKIDLLDLNAFVDSYSDNESNQVIRLEPTIETLPLLVDNISLNSDDLQATIEGDIENIFNDTSYQETVKFKPVSDGAISIDNPVQVSLDVQTPLKVTQLTIQGTKDNAITEGSVVITDDNGDEIETAISLAKMKMTRSARANQAVVQSDGSIVIDLKTQIAVKKVTIRVTATASKSLVEISKVEFLNGMEDHIPAPKLDIPTGIVIDELDSELYIKWDAINNITGYKVKVTYNGKSEEHKVNKNLLDLKSFNNDDLLNGKTYEISVKAINDADKDSLWESDYSQIVKASPQVSKVPDAPDNVKAAGGYRIINLSWKDMKNTDSYNIFYREKGTDKYIQAVGEYVGTTYTINSLKDNTRYEVYVTGNNKKGTGPASLVSEATTVNIKPAKLPQYKLINTSNGTGNLSSHINNVYYGSNGVCQIINSPLDEESTTANSALALVDNNYDSYIQINDWDFGISYHRNWRLTFEFDDTYEMNYISFAGPVDGNNINNIAISYYDENGKEMNAAIDTFRKRTDDNGRSYYIGHLSKAIKTNKVRFGVQSSNRNIRIAEFNFYYYDSLESDVDSLFTDAFHLTLRDDVTISTIEELQTRLDTPDEVSQELHPFKDLIQLEINQAQQIVEGKALQNVQEIHNEISSKKQGNLGFGGLNSWQPLGYVTYPGDTFIIYVGQSGKRNGQAVNLQLVYSQYHGESASFVSNPINLKVGKNEINIKELQSIAAEKGGSVYVQYTGNTDEQIAIRVSGGHQIAALDLYQISDHDERLQKVKDYLQVLQKQINVMKSDHEQLHRDNVSVDYDYDEKNCILSATEIMLDQMLYSVSGKQILAGLTGSTLDEKAVQLLNSLDGMDQMMELFYQNKGLNKNADTINNQFPRQHLNIRYQRMFAGAFMYAGGNHVGIEWGSVAGLTKAIPFESTDNGKYLSGSLFGWGIAHEIGHNINQSSYAIAEITNNYFSLLSQNRDSNETTRFKYPDVYEKVTSNTVGRSSNVFTQLAMYWQLHLAYDQNYHYKLYDSYEEQLNSLFFARVDYYARNPDKVNIPAGGAALKLNSDAEQNFVRLACVAANKDLTNYFTAWGIIPNEETKTFISQFEQETRKIQYLDDDSMAYRLDDKEKMSKDTEIMASIVNEKNSNQVTIKISNTNLVDNAMLGYEILRNGQTVGFINADSGETVFTDTVSTMNNCVFTYSVVGYDRLLNQTEECFLKPIKVSHDGSLDKGQWMIETNLVSSADATIGNEDSSPCQPEQKAINNLIDNDYQSNYAGTTTKEQGEFIISLNALVDITGIKLTNPSFDRVKVYISSDKVNWTLVKEDSFKIAQENKLYFSQIIDGELQNNQSLVSYLGSYVKIVTAGAQEISLSEIDVLGPTGDNIDMAQESSIGILSKDYKLDANNVIPKGSLIFTGIYAGNPAYNVVELKYNDDILSGYQVIFAEDPGENDLADVSEGTWVYYLIPETDKAGKIIENSFGYQDDNGNFVKVQLPNSIRPELYRVNDAQTNAGQRLVSDSFEVNIPVQLPSITLGNQKKGGK